MARSPYNSGYGYRPKANWGEGEALSPYTEGDIVLVPNHRPEDRISGPEGHRIFRVISAFSIGEDASFYFRTAPMFPRGRGDRWITDDTWISDRLHVIPGECDFTAGWIKLHDASTLASEAAQPETSPASSSGARSSEEGT